MNPFSALASPGMFQTDDGKWRKTDEYGDTRRISSTEIEEMRHNADFDARPESQAGKMGLLMLPAGTTMGSPAVAAYQNAGMPTMGSALLRQDPGGRIIPANSEGNPFDFPVWWMSPQYRTDLDHLDVTSDSADFMQWAGIMAAGMGGVAALGAGGFLGAGAGALEGAAAAGASTGAAGAAANTAGLAAMAADAGLVGAAADAFIASGGALGSTAAGGGGIVPWGVSEKLAGFNTNFNPFDPGVNPLSAMDFSDPTFASSIAATNPLLAAAATEAASIGPSAFQTLLKKFGVEGLTSALKGGSSISSLLSAAGSLASSALGSSAVGDAAGTQAAATNAAIAEQRRQFDLTREDYRPYREVGYRTLPTLEADVNKMPTPAEVMSDPGYQFGLDQGQLGLDRKAAASGGRVSGASLKAASTYATNYAATGYNAAYQRRQDRLNRLQALAGIGQTATAGSAAAGTNSANQISGLISNQGDAAAAAQLARGNIWGNAINQLGAAATKVDWAKMLGGDSGGYDWGSAYG